ncbi:tRNA (5-methylaminomethyl-2-thiouridine)(34)-methyltransferase MnmD [Tellurirhabdus rosea]|uniref:tRNA (5-methylaminomethyl-2-thiouridine)(34)-methyltransferase MnmD n=1 Tax=Tellurirhabdus rosea TaxID=2674997 RepID=UPI002B1CBE9C
MENKTESRLVVTADGSHSVWKPETGQYYHSVLGALQESQRVFIELGLEAAFERFEEVRLFEMGFGTGLNALLTLLEAEKRQKRVKYTTVEAYPLPLLEARLLNFDEVLDTHFTVALHETPWGEPAELSPFFSLTKYQTRLQDFRMGKRFNLVYFDAFAPSSQPELWNVDVFQQLARMMLPGGLLTTYCSKGYVQRNLKAAGFTVEKHPGPARKREVLRAILQ